MKGDNMNKQDYVELFNKMHPGFFESEAIRRIPSEEIYDEMTLDLSKFDEGRYEKAFGENISFGYYTGKRDDLLAAIEKVVPSWIPIFDGRNRVYCGFSDGEIASFCLIEDMGSHSIGNRLIKVGGPGCVGTVPEFRRLGIGLCMVRDVTGILKQEGYDISYIHYTGVPNWYEKLGYQTVLRWNRDGIL